MVNADVCIPHTVIDLVHSLLAPARGQFDYLNDYSDVDKVKMMESLIRYTKTLQDRVEVRV
jgi:hypothetical protein